MRCDTCGHVHTDGYFNPAALELLLPDGHPGQEPGTQSAWNRTVWARLVEKVALLQPRGRWLDVGSGNGALIFAAEKWGYSTVGLDLLRETVARMQALGFDARCQDLAQLEETGRYDIVSLCDTLEHDHNFSRRRLHSLLEEHGFEPVRFGVGERNRLGMEVHARRSRPTERVGLEPAADQPAGQPVAPDLVRSR